MNLVIGIIIGFLAGASFVAWGVWKKAETHDMTRIGTVLYWKERQDG